MNRSTCASGSGYVPSVSIGFCVARTRNGAGTAVRLATDRDLVLLHHLEQSALDLGRRRLISSARRRFVKTGPSEVVNSPVFWL